MYARILLPIDGSAGTERATATALDLADRFDTALDVLFVVDTSVFPLDTHARRVFEERMNEGRCAVDETVDRATERGIEHVRGVVERGTPHRVILDYAADVDADLVVMGTHGRCALDRVLLGSVTERVVRLADVPVFAVPMQPAESTP